MSSDTGGSFYDPNDVHRHAGAKKLKEDQQTIQGKLDRLARMDQGAAQFIVNQMTTQRVEFILEAIMPMDIQEDADGNAVPQNLERVEFEKEWNQKLMSMIDHMTEQVEQSQKGLAVPDKRLHIPGVNGSPGARGS